MNTYHDRNALLLQLGYATYADYLNSELWAKIRTDVLARDNRQCKLCDGKAGLVHHLDYSELTLRGLALTKLVAVCWVCHKKIEFNSKGEKRTLAESQQSFRRLLSRKYITVIKKKYQKRKRSRRRGKRRQ